VIKLVDIEQESQGPDRGVDIVAHIEVSGRRHALVCEVKANGQPRHVRMSLLQLRNYVVHHAQDATPVVIAPYLSPEAQALCREQAVGFLDLEGNARLLFDTVFIDRQVASRPVVERRELRSLFKPKSAQVLRVMLREPSRAWRVTELAEMADVSLGHVSNVRGESAGPRMGCKCHGRGPTAIASLTGIAGCLARRLTSHRPAKRMNFYTTLHGNRF
jgi:hypothetical protein